MPDDRSPGCVIRYGVNSLDHMLTGLSRIVDGDMGKLQTFERDASALPADAITERCDLAFIDGMHTDAAVRSDFAVCERFLRPDGVILFHDTSIVHPAIRAICRDLRRRRKPHRAVFFCDDVFALFLDPALADSDPHLASGQQVTAFFWVRFMIKLQLRRRLPTAWLARLRNLRQKTLRQAPTPPKGLKTD